MLGTLLGNYRVVEQLGEGGMGVVYLGCHETLGHCVAVKVLQAELSRDSDMVRRFFNEAQAAAAVRNPGIVQVFDFGTTPDGRAYFVMELLDGQNLEARLKQRRLSYMECCRIGRQIANVLQAAHARGITHRDLKPDNLFLVPDAEVIGGERVKVLDFGIAKLNGDVRSSGVKTRTGLLMGTPYYMSPEQCRGAGAVDARADIYSLGCILFEMTCGRPPFVGAGAGEILGAHQYLDPPHPQRFAPDMPPAFAVLIAKMLAKHPDARPQAMSAVSQALEDLLHELGAPARVQAPARASPAMPISGSGPRPLSAPPAPPASTTLSGMAGVSNERPHPAHRIPFVLGGLVVAGAAAAIVLVVLNASDAADSSLTITPAAAEIASTTSYAAAAAGGPLVRQIDEAQIEDRLKANNPALATEPKRRALVENELPQITAFKTAIRERNLKQARAELDAIPPAVTDHAELRQQYDILEALAISGLVARLARVNGGDCREYNQLVRQEQQRQPPRVAAEATLQVKCSPVAVPTCTHQALDVQGKAQFASGLFAAALSSYEAAWSCRQDPAYAVKGFIAACNIPHLTKAKLFWMRMPLSMRQRSLVVCVRNGIVKAQLDAPSSPSPLAGRSVASSR